MGVSRRSYAAQRGVSEAAVRKAIATGRITTLPDGTIDPARSVNRPQDQIYLLTNLSFHPTIFADNAANAEQSWLLQQGRLT